MTEFMTEQLVKREETLATKVKKVLLILVTALVVWVALMVPILIFVAFIVIAVDIFLFPRMNVEFEYLYFNGDLDIDKIFNKSSRKRMFRTNIKEDMYLIAPTGASELYQFREMKKLDFSTRNPENKTYTMIATHKGEKVQVIFEPNEEILKGIRDLAPRKIIL